MLMAGPAVNLASILVVRKAMGRRFTWIYILTIVVFSILFGLLLNTVSPNVVPVSHSNLSHSGAMTTPNTFKLICAIVLTLLIIFALTMKLFERFTHKAVDPDTTVYTVEGMNCSHCEAAVVRAVESIPGVESAKASASGKSLSIKGQVAEDDVRAAVEKAGYTFKGKK